MVNHRPTRSISSLNHALFQSFCLCCEADQIIDLNILRLSSLSLSLSLPQNIFQCFLLLANDMSPSS